MKKIFATISVLFFLAAPAAFAATTYSRDPAGSGSYASMDVSFSFDDSSDFSCGVLDFNGWYLELNSDTGPTLDSPTYLPADLSETYTFTLPAGYAANEVDVKSSCTGGDTFIALEGYSASPLFTGPAAPASGEWFTAAPTAGTGIISVTTDSFADPGTIIIISLVIGIPLGFYFVERVIGIVPRPKKKVEII